MESFTPNEFTVAFLVALALATATRLWLALRQVGHVHRHRDSVPESFASTITLPAHQKAADYSIAKTRLGIADVALGVAVCCLRWAGGWKGSPASGRARSNPPGTGTAWRSR